MLHNLFPRSVARQCAWERNRICIFPLEFRWNKCDAKKMCDECLVVRPRPRRLIGTFYQKDIQRGAVPILSQWQFLSCRNFNLNNLIMLYVISVVILQVASDWVSINGGLIRAFCSKDPMNPSVKEGDNECR